MIRSSKIVEGAVIQSNVPIFSVPAFNVQNTKKKKEKKQFTSIRTYYGDNEDDVYIMDAKGTGNIGRYLNVSCLEKKKVFYYIIL